MLHMAASLEGIQTSLLPVSSCKITSWPGVPTEQVAKYPPLAIELVISASCVAAARLRNEAFG